MSADSVKSTMQVDCCIILVNFCITWFDHCTMWFDYCTLRFDHCTECCLKNVQVLPNMSTHVMSGPGQATCNLGRARSANNAISANICCMHQHVHQQVQVDSRPVVLSQSIQLSDQLVDKAMDLFDKV